MVQADKALAEIKAHEDICAVRYKGIEDAIKEMRGWIIGTFVSVLLLVLTMLGFVTVRYFDAVTKAPAVQVQTTVK